MHVKLTNRFLNKPGFKHIASASILYAVFIAILVLLIERNPNPMPESPAYLKQKPMIEKTVLDTELNQVVSWPLFGLATTSTLQKVKDSNLQLVGIIFAGKESVAIIRVNGVQQLLTNGSRINNTYTVSKIERMRVIVTSTDGLEQFELFENKIMSEKQTARDFMNLDTQSLQLEMEKPNGTPE